MTLLASLWLVACGPPPIECADIEKIEVFLDEDQDGYGQPGTARLVCDVVDGLSTNSRDCDDSRAEVSPAAFEECDGIDNDCDDDIDENLVELEFFLDADLDGFGDPTQIVPACAPGPGYAPTGDDCDDSDPLSSPLGTEFCDGKDNDCDGLIDDSDPSLDPETTPWWYADQDGDGYGDPDLALQKCDAPPGSADNADDCNDNDPDQRPGVGETCDGIDNDCDGLRDESDPDLDPAELLTWFADSDLDGFGDPDTTIAACTQPWFYVDNNEDCDDEEPLLGLPDAWLLDNDGDGYGAGPPSADSCTPPYPDYVLAAYGIDCNDANIAQNPGAIEICNTIDDDCDGLADDADPDIDPDVLVSWHVDDDGDGFGNPDFFVDACRQPADSVLDDSDCDDGDEDIHPDATEVCNGFDDDCDALIDDADDSLDPSSQLTWYADLDKDGVGNDASDLLACDQPELYTNIGGDCDDTDPDVGAASEFLDDADGDGYGAGVPPIAGEFCLPPIGGTVPASNGIDCAPLDPDIHPDAVDVCADGVDQDCAGGDAVCRTCLEIQDNDPSPATGTHTINPDGITNREVWCDMDVDGGGWTLVTASVLPMDDAGVGYSTTLRTASPGTTMTGLWNGLRSVITGNSDIRFACKDDNFDTAMRVDLSFYDVPWYSEITVGADSASCFNEADGAGFALPEPSRRNNKTGVVLALGDAYGAGFLEGEDSCGDALDFTVDFDDRGMDGNPNDGTDWGEANGTKKCGTSGNGDAFLVFVRE
jgi:hypothetical protein